MPCLLKMNASISLQASFNNIEKLTVITPGNKGIHTRQAFYKDKVNDNQPTMLDRATRSLGTTKVTSNVAFMAGSSQQGNARRASVG